MHNVAAAAAHPSIIVALLSYLYDEMMHSARRVATFLQQKLASAQREEEKRIIIWR